MKAAKKPSAMLLLIAFFSSIAHADKYPPRFQGTPKLQYNAEVGEDKRLRCVVTGQPPPTITWSKDGKPLQLSERVRNLSSNKTIKIKQVRLGDQGNYTCIAENAFGKLNLTLTLIVRQGISASISTSQLTSTTQVPPTQVQAQGAPTFSDPSMLKRAFRAWPASHSIRLKCLATGAPPLKYTWLKNGEKMRKRRMDPYLNTSIWYLALKNLVPDDSGKYTCIVSNPYGSINHTYTLQVVAKPRSRPILEKGLPKNTTVQIGDNATMTCIVLVSGTLPDFRWLKWEKSVTSMPKLGDDLENGLYRLIDPHYYKFIQVEGNYGAELRITNVTEEDFGLYTCFVSNHIGNDYNSAFLSEYVKPTAPVRVTTPTVGKITEENTRNASIEDKYPPRFQGTPKLQYNAEVGEDKRLRCVVTGQPPPTITWSKDGKPLQLSERVRNLSSNKTIKIKQVRLGDQGNYTCIAENALGKINLTLKLHVRQDVKTNYRTTESRAPTFSDPSMLKRAFRAWPASHSIRLKCLATGALPLKYTWLKNGEKMPKREMDPYLNTSIWYLKLKDLMPDDSGKYTCIVSNPYGSINHTYTLQVVAKPRSRPILEKGLPKNTTVQIGDNAAMTCIVLASGTLPDFRWLKWEKSVTSMPKLGDDLENGLYRLIDPHYYKIIQVEGNYGAELRITNVTEEDFGLYTCFVSNHIGNDYNSAFLSEYVKPTAPVRVTTPTVGKITEENTRNASIEDKYPPRFQGTPKLQYNAEVGEDRRLRCVVTGQPPPTITWSKDGKPLQLSERVRNLSSNKTIKIKQVRLGDQGNYTCIAENALGKINLTLKLHVRQDVKIHYRTTESRAPTFSDPSMLKRAFRAWPASHSIRLKCLATGALPLKYTWLKNGEKMPKREMDPYLNTSIWYLKLKDLMPDDSGKYTCIVSNPYGSINHTYTLQVVAKPRSRPILEKGLPKNTTVQIGDNAAMTCIVLASGTLPDFRWLKWEKSVTSMPKLGDDLENGLYRLIDPHYYKIIQVEGNYGAELRITNVTEEDFGLYTCFVSNHIGNDYDSAFLSEYVKPTAPVRVTTPTVGKITEENTRNASIEDKYPPRFQGTPKLQYNAEVGEDRRLRCVVTGQPPPTITWSKDGKPLQLSERVRNLSSNKTIKIKQVRLGDQGNYTCIAENALGKINLTLKLHVRQDVKIHYRTTESRAPTFSDPSMLKRAFRAWPASHSIRLKCLATGALPLKYTWLKNGEKMPKREMDPYLNTSIWYLKLKDLMPDDSGKYTCIVSNPYGSINHTYTLQVVAKPRSRPILEKGLPKNTTVQIGDNAAMTCIVLASGTLPDFRWLKWEKSVTSMPKLGDDLENGLYRLIDPHYYKIIQVEGNYGAELRITNVTEEDFGLYTCFVSNHIGNDYNSAFLSEYVKPTAPVRVTTPTVGKITEENTRNASIEDKYPPRFQGTPKLQYNAEVGEDRRLRCVVTGQPPPTITWSKDGKPLQLSERVRNLSSNKTIKIKQVRLGDQGNYTCIAENALGKINLTLKLHVRQDVKIHYRTTESRAPTFSDPSMLKRAFRAWPASHSIRLKCLATGALPLKYTWLKNGEKMPKREMDPYLNTSIWYLKLKDLMPDDSGKYTCIVSNPYGSINHTYTLQVVAKPRSRPILEKGLPKNTTVQIGDNAAMTCIVLASGTLPDFRWLKWEKSVTSMPKLGDDLENGLYRLIDPHYYKIIQVEGNYGAELRITNVTEEDFGLYTCFVSNHIGNDYDSAFLSEYVKPTAPVRVTTPTVGKITEENTRNASIEDKYPPRFQGTPKLQYNAEVGEDRRLRCVVTGQPPPTITWSKDGKPLQLSERVRNLSSNKTIKIKQVRLGDQGNYTCIAENALGKINLTLKLHVRQDVKIHYRTTESRAPTFSDPSMLKRAFRAWPASHSIRLKCLATGALPLKYTWLKNGEKMPKREMDPYLNTSIWYLKLKDLMPDDSGKYTCIVSNPYGSINHTYTLQVVAKPRSRPILEKGLPKNTTVQIGDNAAMTCIVLASGTLPDFRWLKWEKSVTSMPKLGDDLENGLYRLIDPHYYKIIQVEGNYGAELRITNVTEEDFGLYTCFVSNHIGNDYNSAFLSEYVKPTAPVRVTTPTVGKITEENTRNASIEDKYPPRFQGTPKLQYNAEVGEDRRLRCVVTGQPPPTITWSKDGKPLQLSERVRNLSSNKTIKIKQVRLGDQGNYTCIAENALGKINLTLKLHVRQDVKIHYRTTESRAPTFSDPSMLKRAFRAWPASHSIRLKCLATGALPLKYTWLKNGEKMPKREMDPYLNTSIWYLKLKDLMPDDSGKYTCIVSNPYGSINHTYTLQVVAKPRSRPILEKGLPKNTTVQIGDNAAMTCIVLASGTLPDFRWLKWEKSVTSMPKLGDDLENGLYRLIDPHYYKIIQVEGNYGAELRITNVTEEDFGLYTCFVSNHIGNDYDSAFLSEYVKPTAPVRVTTPTVGKITEENTRNASIEGLQGRKEPQPKAARIHGESTTRAFNDGHD
ncbi:hemicentin-1-like isoform X2 [Oculina patagonica]